MKKLLILSILFSSFAAWCNSPVPLLNFPPYNPVQTGIESYQAAQNASIAAQASKQRAMQLEAQRQAMIQQQFANAQKILIACEYKIKSAKSTCGNKCNDMRKKINQHRKKYSWEMWKKPETIRFLFDKATNSMIDSFGNIVHGHNGAGSLYLMSINESLKLKNEFVFDYMENVFTGTEYAIDDSYAPLFSKGNPTTHLKGKCEAFPL